MALLLADVSSAQSDTKAYYQQLANNGVKGVCIKLTEGSASGSNYKNPKRFDQYNFTKDAKMIPSFYHFARYESNADAESEAEFFHSVLTSMTTDKTTPIMLDAEVHSASDYTSASLAFINYMKKLGYSNLAIYSMSSFFTSNVLNPTTFKNAKVKLWIASYGILTKPANSDIWQYSDTFKGYSQDISNDYGSPFTIKSGGGGGGNSGGGSANNNADNIHNGKTKKATKEEYCLSLLALFIDDDIFDTWLH